MNCIGTKEDNLFPTAKACARTHKKLSHQHIRPVRKLVLRIHLYQPITHNPYHIRHLSRSISRYAKFSMAHLQRGQIGILLMSLPFVFRPVKSTLPHLLIKEILAIFTLFLSHSEYIFRINFFFNAVAIYCDRGKIYTLRRKDNVSDSTIDNKLRLTISFA